MVRWLMTLAVVVATMVGWQGAARADTYVHTIGGSLTDGQQTVTITALQFEDEYQPFTAQGTMVLNITDYYRVGNDVTFLYNVYCAAAAPAEGDDAAVMLYGWLDESTPDVEEYPLTALMVRTYAHLNPLTEDRGFIAPEPGNDPESPPSCYWPDTDPENYGQNAGSTGNALVTFGTQPL